MTPFSAHALDRALAAALVPFVRHNIPAYAAPSEVATILTQRAALNIVAEAFAGLEHLADGRRRAGANWRHARALGVAQSPTREVAVIETRSWPTGLASF